VSRFANGKPVEQLSLPDFITCLYRDPDGTMWFAGRKTLWHLEGTTLKSLPGPAGTDLLAQALARDGSGALWYSVSHGGVFRFAEGGWERNGNLLGLPQEAAITMTTDARGRLWLGYTRERLARVEGQRVRLFGSHDGPGVGSITALASRGDHVWIGGERGLALFDGTRFVSVRVPNEAAFGSLWGIVETTAGELWGVGTGGIVHFTHAQLQEVLQQGGALHDEVQIFDARDGLPGPLTLRPIPAVVEAGDGKLWFAFRADLGYIDPAHLERNRVPPPVLVTGVATAAKNYSPFDRDIRLPVGTTQLRIAYTANTFTLPERVRFRYQLEGLDPGWQNVGNRREAVYTNVAPGFYRFHVIAANNDGVWNLAGATVSFTVLPAFYQTVWFDVVCVIAATALLYLLYHLRMRQVTAAVRARLEERIIERQRIARELHDTLLQGLQGVILRFQAVATRIPAHEPVCAMIESALTRADQVLLESRDRVKDIRFSAQASGDLSESLAALGEELAQTHSAQLSIEVHGTQRKLHPVAKDEVIMIGREALSNAFRHAGAAKIEVEIEFAWFELRMRLRDDGKGIEPQMLESDIGSGHWGLRGMRERAEKIRARLRIWSRSGRGTEIELRVPSSVAYRHSEER
jgi:signal transduction histidine kinase